MKPIITHSSMSLKELLPAGESWEIWLVEQLNSLGINCYRPNQNKLYECDRSFFGRLQRDILLKVPDSAKRKVLEVKARKNPFRFATVDVGIKATWAVKEFPVHYLAVIDQATREVRITEADKETRESKWLVRQNRDVCYSVPIGLFKSLKQWMNDILFIVGRDK